MNILQTIEKGHYAATEAQVETLAHAVALGMLGAESYLRVIVAHSQGLLGAKRVGRRSKLDAQSQEAVLDKVHARFYPSVQRGVVLNGLSAGGEVTQAQVNQRATFARSTASDLRAFIARGGDLRSIEVATVTRSWVRKFGKVEAVPTGTRAERSFVRNTEAALKAAERIAKNNPAAAREHLEAALDKFEALLAELPAEGAMAEEPEAPAATPSRRSSDTGPARTRVGVPQLHRGA